MIGQLELVDRSDADAIGELRMREYESAGGFTLNLETLAWRASDDDSFVLVARCDGRIVATMRGELIDDMGLLERKLECPWDFAPPPAMPALLLSRAATSTTHRASGLNLILRHWFLQFAVARDVGSVIGTFVAGSPRENSLRAMGYRFFTNVHGWQQSTYRSLRPVHVVMLDVKADGEHALAYCRANARVNDYAYAADFPQKHFVRCL
jgi:hypothetical protein